MPFLLATSLRRWVLTSVAVPVAAAGARKLARTLEARRGSSAVTRGLTRAADTAQRSRRTERRRGR